MNSILADLGTTAAGGSTGLALLATVNWSAFPAYWGEVAKIGLALILIILGYKAYNKPPVPPIVDAPTAGGK